jgi:hypothetical protein
MPCPKTRPPDAATSQQRSLPSIHEEKTMKPSFRLSTALLLAATFCAQASAARLTTVGDLAAATRPAGVPLNYVVTPNGMFHPSCVHELADSDTLAASGVRHADGSETKLAACAFPRFGASGQVIDGSQPQPDFDGWIAASDSNANVTPAAKKMVGSFTVPSGPSANVGQVLYYFPGLEDGQNVITILQPVLAWNGFSDSRWTMTNWNCCNNGHTFHGGTINVSTGDAIKGSMKGSGCSGNVCSAWKLMSKDNNTGQSTTFNTDAYGQAFDWYFGGVLEAYGVTQCTHFPSNGSITFTGVKVTDVTGAQSTPANWSSFIANGAPACSFAVNASQHVTTITWTTH